MAATYVVMSSEVVIDSSNDALVVEAGSVDETVTIEHGSWYLTGAAATNLATKVAAAIQTHSNVTSCTVSSQEFYINDDIANPTVKLNLTSSPAIKLKPNNVASTFNGNFIGFPDETGSGVALSSDGESLGVWIADQPAANEYKGPFTAEVNQQTALDGSVYTFKRGAVEEMHGFDFDFIIPWKVLIEEENPSLDAAPNATFQSFHQLTSDGRGVKIHQAGLDPDEDTKLYSNQIITDGATWVGQTDWVMNEKSATMFAPRRFSAGLELYSFPVRLRKKV